MAILGGPPHILRHPPAEISAFKVLSMSYLPKIYSKKKINKGIRLEMNWNTFKCKKPFIIFVRFFLRLKKL